MTTLPARDIILYSFIEKVSSDKAITGKLRTIFNSELEKEIKNRIGEDQYKLHKEFKNRERNAGLAESGWGLIGGGVASYGLIQALAHGLSKYLPARPAIALSGLGGSYIGKTLPIAGFRLGRAYGLKKFQDSITPEETEATQNYDSTKIELKYNPEFKELVMNNIKNMAEEMK